MMSALAGTAIQPELLLSSALMRCRCASLLCRLFIVHAGFSAWQKAYVSGQHALQVSDPFNAIAVKGMLESLLDQGTVVVCTSNSSIRQLNRHGVHEDLFSGFQERMLAVCDEVELSAKQDYRLSFGQAVHQEVGTSEEHWSRGVVAFTAWHNGMECGCCPQYLPPCFSGTRVNLAGRVQLSLPSRCCIYNSTGQQVGGPFGR